MEGRRVLHQFLSAPADADRALFAVLTEPSCLGLRVTLPRAEDIMNASPGAVGPACRLRRRYAHAPAAALLTGLDVGELSSLRSA